MSQAMPLATYCKNYTLPRHSFEPVSQFVEDTSWQAESERPIDWRKRTCRYFRSDPTQFTVKSASLKQLVRMFISI